jgi:hypothetical protein
MVVTGAGRRVFARPPSFAQLNKGLFAGDLDAGKHVRLGKSGMAELADSGGSPLTAQQEKRATATRALYDPGGYHPGRADCAISRGLQSLRLFMSIAHDKHRWSLGSCPA